MIEWVSVDDRLPNDGESVLIWIGYREAWSGASFGNGGVFMDSIMGAIEGVTHWARVNPPSE